MTVKELKDLLRDLPDDTPIELFNSSYEWYGIEPVPSESIRMIDGHLVIHFGGSWGEPGKMLKGYGWLASEEERYLDDRNGKGERG